MQNTKQKYYKAIYLAARKCVSAAAQNDEQAVKALRDHECWERFNKSYSELTIPELNSFLDDLNGKTESEIKFASARQLSQLKYYMLACALKYVDFTQLQYIDQHTGEILRGENLQNNLTELFYSNLPSKPMFPANVVRELYDTWINPRSNTMLMEGGHKSLVRNPNVCYYEKLSAEAVAYLINRYQLMHNNKINKTATIVPVCMN